MKKVKWFTVALCVTTTLLLSGCMILARYLGTGRDLPIDYRYLPGNPVPNLPARCEWYDYSYTGGSTCIPQDRTPAIYFDRDVATNTIRDVLFDTPGVRLGDVMRLWGTPIGADYWQYGVQIYWRDGYSVWVLDEHVTPFSGVTFIEIDPHETPESPWRGLRTNTPVP